LAQDQPRQTRLCAQPCGRSKVYILAGFIWRSLLAAQAPKTVLHGAGEVLQRFIEELENDDEGRNLLMITKNEDWGEDAPKQS